MARTYCGQCGAALRATVRFCTACGHPVAGGEAEAAALFEPGQLLGGRWRLQRPLGRGGMGEVWLALDTRLADRPAALKALRTTATGDTYELAVERFHREARTLANLHHPGIPQIYDRFSTDDLVCLAMEYVNGVDLLTLLRQRQAADLGPIPAPEVLRWGWHIAEVLHHLHSQEPTLVHRDLKPANILITAEGQLKVIDFGIAKLVAAEGQGTGLGTRGYAAPEQYRGDADPRSDLYGLGATLHHLLTGRDPQGEAPFDFPVASTLVPGVAPALDGLLRELLALAPADRPGSAAAVMLRLGLLVRHPETRQPDREVLDLVAQMLNSQCQGVHGQEASPPGLPDAAASDLPVAAPWPFTPTFGLTVPAVMEGKGHVNASLRGTAHGKVPGCVLGVREMDGWRFTFGCARPVVGEGVTVWCQRASGPGSGTPVPTDCDPQVLHALQQAWQWLLLEAESRAAPA